ncbi:hypothetical protein AB1Y20_017181 [Prymnesium parvum]|uniref:Uncharacterized protein n=1 Tax=Prymnesium parvum TaxID=97485 RepID=A0AB34I8H6_PRYPA
MRERSDGFGVPPAAADPGWRARHADGRDGRGAPRREALQAVGQRAAARLLQAAALHLASAAVEPTASGLRAGEWTARGNAQLKYRLLERCGCSEARLPFVFSAPVLSTLPINVSACLVEIALRGGAAQDSARTHPAGRHVFEAELASAAAAGERASHSLHACRPGSPRRHLSHAASSPRGILPLYARLGAFGRVSCGRSCAAPYGLSSWCGWRLRSLPMARAGQTAAQRRSPDLLDLLVPQHSSAAARAHAEWSFELTRHEPSSRGRGVSLSSGSAEPWLGGNDEIRSRRGESSRRPAAAATPSVIGRRACARGWLEPWTIWRRRRAGAPVKEAADKLAKLGLGLLADGAVECKLPADFTGAVAGESEKKTTGILLKAVRWGGARDIRGLHTLNEYSSFGRIVLDTIVSHAHDAPGENVAVLRLGHEKQMKERPLEASPRLDSGSEASLAPTVARPLWGREASRLVRLPTERLAARGGAGALELAGLGLSNEPPDAGAESALSSLVHVERVRRHLDEGKAGLKQCEADGMEPSCGRTSLRANTLMAQQARRRSRRRWRRSGMAWGCSARRRGSASVGRELQRACLGQAAPKATEAMEEAQRGVLLIDEACALGGGAFDPLVRLMAEPQHKHKPAVLLAADPAEMDSRMATPNPRLRRRVCGRVEFCEWGMRRTAQSDARSARGRGWVNARDAEQAGELFYKALDVHAAVEELRRRRPAGEPAARGHSRVQLYAQPPPAPHAPQPPRVSEAMEADEARAGVMEEMQVQLQPKDGDDDPIFAALMLACREPGYDGDHEHRLELIEVLQRVMGGACWLPIIHAAAARVRIHRNGSRCRQRAVLKPQLPRALVAMQECCEEAERRREERRRL